MSADSVRGIAIDTTGTIRPLALEFSTGRIVRDRHNWSATLHQITPDTVIFDYHSPVGIRPYPNLYRAAYHRADATLTLHPGAYPPLLAQGTAVPLGSQVTAPVRSLFQCTMERQTWRADTIRSRDTLYFRADSIGATLSAFATSTVHDTGTMLTIHGRWNHRLEARYTQTMELTLPQVDSVGTYALGSETVGTGYYWYRNDDVLGGGSTQDGEGSGQLTLTMLDWTTGRCAGTFQFTTGRLFDQGSTTYLVTHGIFDVPLRVPE